MIYCKSCSEWCECKYCKMGRGYCECMSKEVLGGVKKELLKEWEYKYWSVSKFNKGYSERGILNW